MLVAFSLAFAAPPVPPAPTTAPAPVAATWHYRGPGREGEYAAAEIAAYVSANPSAKHYVWQSGWTDWREWYQVPDIARLVTQAPKVQTWSYVGNGGATETLTTKEVVARIQADPQARHLIWRAGMAGWAQADSVPEIRQVLPAATGTFPPPAPGESRDAPPPLPSAVRTNPYSSPSGADPYGPAPSNPYGPPSGQYRPPPPSDADAPPEGPPPVPGGRTGRETPPPPDQPPGGRDPNRAPDGPPVSVRPHPLPQLQTELGGDFRFDLAFDDLQDMGDEEDPALPGFRVSRGRANLGSTLGDGWKARFSLDVHQTAATTEYPQTDGSTFTVTDYPDGWTLVGHEAWLQWEGKSGATKHHIRAGVQEPTFGLVDRYDRPDGYYLGGTSAFVEIERRAGLVPFEDAGVAYGAVGPAFALDIQVLNGGGALETNAGKDYLARVSVSPIRWFNVAASGLYGQRSINGDASLAEAAGAIELRGRNERLIAEVVGGRSTEKGADGKNIGWTAAGACDLHPKVQAIDRVTVVVGSSGIDPKIADVPADEAYPDSWLTVSGAVQVYWHTLIGRSILTGVNYEYYRPENIEIPIGHSVVAQAAWTF
jgi:hypothetical protein